MSDDLPMAFPLMKDTDHWCYPGRPLCPMCGASFASSGGLAYLMCGALAVDPVTRDEVPIPAELESHFHIGFHSSDAEMRGASDIPIVDNLHSGQFDIQFCSLSCLRKWFNQVIDSLEREATETQ